jgi:hypothetical protein
MSFLRRPFRPVSLVLAVTATFSAAACGGGGGGGGGESKAAPVQATASTETALKDLNGTYRYGSPRRTRTRPGTPRSRISLWSTRSR